MNREEPNQASAKEQAERPRQHVNPGAERNLEPDHDFDVDEMDGKTDSGPEPDVHGREIPPQE